MAPVEVDLLVVKKAYDVYVDYEIIVDTNRREVISSRMLTQSFRFNER